MTKEDIKKALEFCAQDNYYFCGGCSYDDVRNCNDKLKTDALNVIIEQEKEIERLKAEVKQAKLDVLNELKKYLHTEDFDTPDERWKPESEFCAIIDKLIKEIENDNRRN